MIDGWILLTIAFSLSAGDGLIEWTQIIVYDAN